MDCDPAGAGYPRNSPAPPLLHKASWEVQGIDSGRRLPGGAVIFNEGCTTDPLSGFFRLQILGSYPLKIFTHFI